jgi:hypothetical protein
VSARRAHHELDDDALEARARTLYPDDRYLQQQWLRAVRLVRTTARGWLLEAPPLRRLRLVPTPERADETPP